MVAFLNWSKSIALGTLNTIAKLALFVILLIVVLMIVGMLRGDGLPDKIVLTADLRSRMADSSRPSPFGVSRPLTVMDFVLALDRAAHDSRVRGLFLRVGDGGLSVAQAEEIGAAIHRFRQSGRFVIAHSQGFNSAGLGDYLAAASATEIWMQPKSPYGAAGAGAGNIFLKGFFDKIQAVPQNAKRADYKNAADTLMQKEYTAPDREQTTAFLRSWYDSGTRGVAAERKLPLNSATAVFERSPQFAEEVQRAHLIDRIGYDDDAKDASIGKAGGARAVSLPPYRRNATDLSTAGRPQIAV